MTLSTLAYTSLLLPLVRGAAIQPRQGGIKWGPCPDSLNTTLPVECAKLPVPLDYTDEASDKTLDLDLIKYPAQDGPSQGSIILNFGGPGQDGLVSMTNYAPLQAPVVGGQYDLVSFDPRGTGNTLLFDCYQSPELAAALATFNQDAWSASEATPGKVWAEAQIISDTCGATLKDTGDLVGMAFVARDIMQIVDALDEGGMLRYWGISGGTTMGATVAAMFPDRMERVILDGNMNVQQYWNGWESEISAATDATFHQMLAGCLDAGPELCPFPADKTADELEEAIFAKLECLKLEPIPVPELSFVLSYSLAKARIHSTLYRPIEYPQLAKDLAALLQGDGKTLLTSLLEGGGAVAQAQAISGIRCGDKVPRVDSLAVARDEIFPEYLEVSEHFSDTFYGAWSVQCMSWPFEAKERYTGDFQVKTKNPVLLLNQRYDPVTPLVSAFNTSSGFEGSVVLEASGFGHTSLAHKSNCTNDYIAKYFVEGTLPEEGTVCEPNEKIFQFTPVPESE